MKAVLIAVGVALLMATGGAVHADSYSPAASAGAYLGSYNAVFNAGHSISDGFTLRDGASLRDWQPSSQLRAVRITDGHAASIGSSSMGSYCPTPTPTPEPDTALLLGTGMLLLAGGGIARRRVRMQ
ncbi:MAG TPA: PEP-CTERM sorting domain-containing protein [Candidatus Acidoferrales bacterium]|nr:PEP-CTERM sorting domain-containing protein [Candidatus Acidoferrales bacterium]